MGEAVAERGAEEVAGVAGGGGAGEVGDGAAGCLDAEEVGDAGCVEAGGLQEVAGAVADCDKARYEAVAGTDGGGVAVEVLDEGAGDFADAEEDDVEVAAGVFAGVEAVELEGAVEGAGGVGDLRLADDDRDVELGGGLGDGDEADALLGEGGHNACGDAGGVGHAEADDGEDAAVWEDGDVVDGAFCELDAELLLEGGLCRGDLGGRDGEADGGFGAGLADEGDADFVPREGAEDACSDAGDAGHAAAFDIDDGLSGDGADGLDGV